MSDSPVAIKRTPEFSERSAEILIECFGISSHKLEKLRIDGIV